MRALRDIKEGEELTIGYGKDYKDDKGKKMKCFCGEEKCSGWIGIQNKYQAATLMKNHPELFPNEGEDEENGSSDAGKENEEMSEEMNAALDEDGNDDEEMRSAGGEEEEQNEDSSDDEIARLEAECEDQEEEESDPVVKLLVRKVKTFDRIQWQRNSANKQANYELPRPSLSCICSANPVLLKQKFLIHLIRNHPDEAAGVFSCIMEGKPTLTYQKEFAKAKFVWEEGKFVRKN